jgi:hypothetical protein
VPWAGPSSTSGNVKGLRQFRRSIDLDAISILCPTCSAVPGATIPDDFRQHDVREIIRLANRIAAALDATHELADQPPVVKRWLLGFQAGARLIER